MLHKLCKASWRFENSDNRFFFQILAVSVVDKHFPETGCAEMTCCKETIKCRENDKTNIVCN